MIEREIVNRIGRIDQSEYAVILPAIKHVYLIGNLQRATAYPFVRDTRVEFTLCSYNTGSNGEYHWHRYVTEYGIVIEGEIGYFEVATGETHWFYSGDLCVIPEGVCVKRLVRQAAYAVVVKVPSRDDRIHCSVCPRECIYRVESYKEAIR
jgi:uncharacterized cupin superfamily protein